MRYITAYVMESNETKLFNFWTENFWLLFSSTESHSAVCAWTCVCAARFRRRELTQILITLSLAKIIIIITYTPFSKLVAYERCMTVCYRIPNCKSDDVSSPFSVACSFCWAHSPWRQRTTTKNPMNIPLLFNLIQYNYFNCGRCALRTLNAPSHSFVHLLLLFYRLSFKWRTVESVLKNASMWRAFGQFERNDWRWCLRQTYTTAIACKYRRMRWKRCEKIHNPVDLTYGFVLQPFQFHLASARSNRSTLSIRHFRFVIGMLRWMTLNN